MASRRRRLPWLLFGTTVILAVAFWIALPYLLPEGGVTIGLDGVKTSGSNAPAASEQAVEPSADILPLIPSEASTPAPAASLPLSASPSSAPAAPPGTAPQPRPGARLLIPVQGVRPEGLVDTYTQSRSQGRQHNAIDIAAPRGTPVLAAADGRVIKLFQSDQGGTTLYQLDPDGRTIYYYAHLDGYAPGIAEGQVLRQGQVLGYVGDTGNAGAGNYHLHFGVSLTDDPEQFWGGQDVNPYPLLVGGR